MQPGLSAKEPEMLALKNKEKQRRGPGVTLSCTRVRREEFFVALGTLDHSETINGKSVKKSDKKQRGSVP